MRRVVLACAAFALACALLSGDKGSDWQSRRGLDDPRVGRIWDTAAHKWVERDDLLQRARLSDFVLLGEKHDNPDHHHLQGVVIQSLARERIPPRVAFEMLSEDDRPALDAWHATHPEDVEALGDMLDWKHSGWPPWRIYEPVFMAAISRSLAIEPANLTKDQMAQLRATGIAGIPAERRQRLALDPPISGAASESLAQEIREGHCGMANDQMVESMIAIQRVRDATLADSLVRGGAPAVLIAGAGHVRKDRAVPVYLGRREPERRVLSIAFREVSQGESEKVDDDYGTAFDFVWFTPRVDDLDPCERFKKELEKMRPREPSALRGTFIAALPSRAAR